MRKYIWLLSLVLSFANLSSITKGSLLSTPKVDDTIFKMRCVREQVKKLIKIVEAEEDLDEFLKEKRLDKYFKATERKKVKEISDNLGIDEKWLYLVIWYESRGNPQAENPYSGASGIIQFLPSTAKVLGTTVQDIRNMSIIEQLELTERYLNRYKEHLNSYQNTYLAIFYPKALGKSKDYEIGRGKVAKDNPNVDINQDDVITVAEFWKYST